MADLISQQDSLNEGRNKINNIINDGNSLNQRVDDFLLEWGELMTEDDEEWRID